jgi:hypothetical protein
MGIKPMHAVLQTTLLSENRLVSARGGNRTRIYSLEDCRPAIERHAHWGAPGGSRTRTALAKSSLGKTRFPASPHRSGARCLRNPELTPPGAASAANVARGCFRQAGSNAPFLTVPVVQVFRCSSVEPLGQSWSRRESNSHHPGANREFCRRLNYDPAGREGIEPSRLSFGGSAVATTQPKSGNKGCKELIAPKKWATPRKSFAWSGRLDSNRCTPHGICRAPRTGVEPVSLHRQWSCDAGRITRHLLGVPGRTQTCIVSV